MTGWLAASSKESFVNWSKSIQSDRNDLVYLHLHIRSFLHMFVELTCTFGAGRAG